MRYQRCQSLLRDVKSISLLLFLAVFLGGQGCRTSSVDTVQVIDLLELLPPDTSVKYDEPSSPSRSWDFADGLPEGWTAGPDGVKIQLRSGGILLESPDGLAPWIEAPITVDPLLRYALLAVMEPGDGWPPLLFYSFSDPPYYHPLHQIGGGGDPAGGRQTLCFKLPGPEGVETKIQALRLYTGTTSGSSVLKRLILQSRRENFLTRQVLSKPLVELAQEYRHCWRIVGSGTREVTLQLPESPARLCFASGSLRGPKPARLTVELFHGEASGKTIYSQPFPGTASGWQDQRVDLTPWHGEEVTVRFRVEGNGSRPVRLIGSPVIRTMPEARRPSVLLIVLDAQRADRLSVYGHNRHTSPHLARLAEEGILFTGATAPCSWTMPSVVATFTGCYDDRARVSRAHGIGVPEVPTLAERFSRAGYATGGFAANHLLTWSKGFTRGFDTWYLAPYQGIPVPAAQLNQRVLRWLRAHRGEETFCYIHYMDPHDPYDAPWPGRSTAAGPEAGGLEANYGWREGYIRPMALDGEKLQPSEIDQMCRFYDRGAAYTDFQIGHLLAALRKEGLLEQTAVLVTADHGDELHDHGSWGHGITLYQEVLHVPTILRLPKPGVEAGTVVHTPISLVDVAPTLTAIAGLPEGEGWSDGQDMLRLSGARPLFSLASGHAPLRFAVVQPPWKYVFFNRDALDSNPPRTVRGQWLADNGQPKELLFNIAEDPGERQDLMVQYPEKAAEMRGLMDAWFAEAGSDGRTAGAEAEPLRGEELERLRALGYVQ